MTPMSGHMTLTSGSHDPVLKDSQPYSVNFQLARYITLTLMYTYTIQTLWDNDIHAKVNAAVSAGVVGYSGHTQVFPFIRGLGTAQLQYGPYKCYLAFRDSCGINHRTSNIVQLLSVSEPQYFWWCVSKCHAREEDRVAFTHCGVTRSYYDLRHTLI